MPLRRPDLRGGEAGMSREFVGRRRVGGASRCSINSLYDLRRWHVAVRARRPGAFRCDSSPSHHEVGGLIFDFELVSGGVIDTYHTQVLTRWESVEGRQVHEGHRKRHWWCPYWIRRLLQRRENTCSANDENNCKIRKSSARRPVRLRPRDQGSRIFMGS